MLPDIDADDEQSDVEEAEREDWCKLPPTYPAHPAYLESNRLSRIMGPTNSLPYEGTTFDYISHFFLGNIF